MVRAIAFLALALALLAALAAKSLLLTPPAPPASPVRSGFDANAAMTRLEHILRPEQPHPVDSPANDAVRERLIAELRGLGLAPRVTDDVACDAFPRSRTISCARVRNVILTIGPSEGRHLLLSSHYDSTFVGPGAADDGIGVAVMLEIAARLRGRPLRRPVTFLFNEGEEMGLIGARAFLERDPVARRVDTVINMEARGVTGPAIMFETSRPNGPAIALYRASAARPVANSLSTDLYRLIPNSTDVTVFLERPQWTILNFAIIGNETRYHSAGDSLAALDRHSLQHMGDQALAAAEHAALRDPPRATGERLYADLLGRVLVVLPLMFGLILLALLLVFFLIEARRRRALGPPLLAMALAAAGSAVVALAGLSLVGLFRPGDFWRAYPLVTTTAVYAGALFACVAALRLAPKAERRQLRVAYWLFFLLVGGVLGTIAPGGTIFFLLPPLVAALGMAAARWKPGIERIAALIAALLLYLTFGPALGLFEELQSGGPFWVFAPLGALIMLPVLIELQPAGGRRAALFVAAALAAIAWLGPGLSQAYSEDRQQRFTIEQVWDATARRSYLAVNNDGAPVPLPGPWERAEVPYAVTRRWMTPIAPRPGPTPAVEVVARYPFAGGRRRVRLRLSPNGFATVALVAPANVRLDGGGIGGRIRPFGRGGAEDRHIVRCVGRSCDGALVDLIIVDPHPIDFILIGTSPGAPAAGKLIGHRPRLARPQYAPDSTIGVTRTRL